MNPVRVDISQPETPFGGVVIISTEATLQASVDVSAQDLPFGGVVMTPPDETFGGVDIFPQDLPFGGVVVEFPFETPLVIEIDSGGAVHSVFGRSGDVVAQLNDYIAFYALKEAGIPLNGAPGYVLTKNTGSDYDVSWKPAAGGGGGVLNVIVGEIPGGFIDGINTVFTTVNVFRNNSLEVYLNGLRQRVTTDYAVIGGSSFQMNQPPLTGDNLRVDYILL